METLKNKIREIARNQSTDSQPIDFEILTDEELIACVKAAVTAKQAHENLLAYTKKISRTQEPINISPEWLYNAFIDRYQKVFKTFEADKFNESILQLLCLYFANDQQFEQGDYSLDKSLMLVGGIGAGKTSMLKIFGVILQDVNMSQQTEKRAFGIVSAQKLAQLYSTEGYPGISRYTKPFNSSFSKDAGWCIDDLGAETTGKHYGKDSNVMQEILEEVYLSGELKGNYHITTNFYATKIEEYYGVRVRSRMREMYNYIDFGKDAPDRRK